MLSAERVVEALDYDLETGLMVWRNCSKYHREKDGTIAGSPASCSHGKFYHKIGLDGRKYSRSRLAFLWVNGRWPDECIDHINGNSLDDRWSNLREASVTENAWNHSTRRKTSNLPMGVRKSRSRFQARLVVNKKMLHLGVFGTIEEAASAYEDARKVHYGKFA